MMKNYYLYLARLAAETFVKMQQVINIPPDCPAELLSQKSGVFVTIEKNHQLRGCVGTYLPTQKNTAQEIIHSAIAATADSRFPRILTKELPLLKYTVSLLSRPQTIKTIKELNPREYGIIVQDSTGKTGLLLPDLEGVDTVLQQIAIACQKAGIDSSAENISLSRFKVQKYTEQNDQKEENSIKNREKEKR